MTGIITQTIKAVSDAVYPHRCSVCGDLTTEAHRMVPSDCPEKALKVCLCGRCTAAINNVEPPVCTVCGRMFTTEDAEDHVCGDCINAPKRFHSARAVGLYSDILRTMIHQLKYNGKTALSRPLGDLLLTGFLKWFDPANVDIVVPVPLHSQKFRQRGFNQAYMLMRGWGRRSRAAYHPWLNEMTIARDVLVRHRKTRSQTTLTVAERRANVRDAFALKDPAQVKDKRVLLVDDVYTTGATVNECAKTLKAGGAKRVYVLTLARVG